MLGYRKCTMEQVICNLCGINEAEFQIVDINVLLCEVCIDVKEIVSIEKSTIIRRPHVEFGAVQV